MTPNGEIREVKSEGRRWHYLAVKKLSVIIKRNNVETSQSFLLSQLPSFL